MNLTDRVFEYFAEICKIPHGSENMEKISDYCLKFAEKNSLKVIKDDYNNVIIFKDGTLGYENSEPIILQGHLDMVCQSKEESDFDFLKDSIEIVTEGDFIKANGTTLGADNGIAVAMILAILESKDIPHPPIEAVFSTDEEIGMIGAIGLNADCLKAKKMINLDSEEDDTLTVSCAGGREFKAKVPVNRTSKTGTVLNISLSGLLGGHSGVDINKKRVNANALMLRILNHIKNSDFELISISGGEKSNVITNNSTVKLLTDKPDELTEILNDYLKIIKREISFREPDFTFEVKKETTGEFSVLDSKQKGKLIYALLCIPHGVVEMSAEIEGLVETSLNFAIIKTTDSEISVEVSLRSNKYSALDFLEEKLMTIFSNIECNITVSGHYPPWEYKENSPLRDLYCKCYEEQFSKLPKIAAIHAGLECGVFSSKIDELDCISLGPQLYDVHTVNERMSVSSAKNIFELLLNILKKSK